MRLSSIKQSQNLQEIFPSEKLKSISLLPHLLQFIFFLIFFFFHFETFSRLSNFKIIMRLKSSDQSIASIVFITGMILIPLYLLKGKPSEKKKNLSIGLPIGLNSSETKKNLILTSEIEVDSSLYMKSFVLSEYINSSAVEVINRKKTDPFRLSESHRKFIKSLILQRKIKDNRNLENILQFEGVLIPVESDDRTSEFF